MKKICIIVLTLLLGPAQWVWADTSGSWADYRDSSWGSDYSTSSTFTISTAAQLAQLAYMTSSEGKDFSGKTVCLDADLDLGSHYWTPIGQADSKSFQGIFDGQGHTVSGININSDSGRQGLFGTISGATIRNVTLSSSTIHSSVRNGATGGIVAYIKKGTSASTIENCHVTGDVSIDVEGHAGGIAGYVLSGVTVIQQCTSAVSIILRRNNLGVGGIVGYCGYSGTQLEDASDITVSDCLYYGSSLTVAEYYSGHIGGIIGAYYSNTNTDIQNYSVVHFSGNYYTHPTGSLKGVGMETVKRGSNTTENTDVDIAADCGAVRARVVTSSEDIADMGTAGTPVENGITPYTYGVKYGDAYYSHVLALPNNADNTALISLYAGQTYDVKLRGRTLYKDDSWNTLCLPFSMTYFTNSIFAGGDCEVREMDVSNSYYIKTGENEWDNSQSYRTGVSDGRLYLFFKSATGSTPYITAGRPYIVKWDKVDGYNPLAPETYDYVSPTFYNVTIVGGTPQAVTSQDGRVSFVPNYEPLSYGVCNRSILFVGAGNSLYYPSGAGTVSLKAFRAHFELNGVQMPESPGGSGSGDDDDDDYIPSGGGEVKAFVLDIEDDATAVNEELRIKNEEFAAAKAWYTLDGIRLAGKPSVKGVYVTGGRKVVIK